MNRSSQQALTGSAGGALGAIGGGLLAGATINISGTAGSYVRPYGDMEILAFAFSVALAAYTYRQSGSKHAFLCSAFAGASLVELGRSAGYMQNVVEAVLGR